MELKNIIELPRRAWRAIGSHAVNLIRRDFEDGIWQNDQQGLTYKSEQYKKYKARDMRRLDGKRLKAYGGRSIESNKTNMVDLTLTGQLKKGLRVKDADKWGVVIGFEPKDAMKIIGNRRFGRDPVGLNKKNLDSVAQLFSTFLDENLREWAKKKITIKM